MWEAVSSLRLLTDPSRGAIHLPWLNELRDGRLREVDLRAVLALLPPRGYIPDFLTPPPSGPLAQFEEEVDAVRATKPEQVAHDLRQLFERRRVPAAARPLLDEPRRASRVLADVLAAYWRLAVEPHWPRIRALLESDLAHRARRLTAGGHEALFEDLHPMVRWREQQRLEVDSDYEATIPLGGSGLLLLPSAFAWSHPAVITGEPWQATVIYPARGIAMLWEPGEPAPEGLTALVGGKRAALLVALDAPRSTTEVAERVGLSPGGASQHLAVLRAAGLVTGRREGRSVLYVRTPLADSLVSGVHNRVR